MRPSLWEDGRLHPSWLDVGRHDDSPTFYRFASTAPRCSQGPVRGVLAEPDWWYRTESSSSKTLRLLCAHTMHVANPVSASHWPFDWEGDRCKVAADRKGISDRFSLITRLMRICSPWPTLRVAFVSSCTLHNRSKNYSNQLLPTESIYPSPCNF